MKIGEKIELKRDPAFEEQENVYSRTYRIVFIDKENGLVAVEFLDKPEGANVVWTTLKRLEEWRLKKGTSNI